MKLKDTLLWVQIGNEGVVLDPDSSMYFRLNHSGAKMWVALTSGATVAELEVLLQHEYCIDPQLAQQDVSKFLRALRERSMLEEDTEPGLA